MKETIYWLGAHKTGTTFLQKSLDRSQKTLRAHQVTYLNLDKFREKYTRPMLNVKLGKIANGVYDHEGSGKNLVFDENIPGLVQHACGPKGLYPEAASRTRRIADHLEMETPTLVLGIRSMVGFLPSLYCESLKANPFQPFRAFLTTPLENLLWYPYIKSLQAAFPGSRMRIYQYELLRSNEPFLLSQITGMPPEKFNVLKKPERPGFSHAAIVALLKIHQTRKVENKDLRASTKRFPKGKRFFAFSPWQPEEIDLLGQSYARDLQQMRDDPDIELLLGAG